MKKITAFFLGIFALSVFAFDNDVHAAKQIGKPEAPIGFDEEGGENDTSMVNLKITKISDYPMLQPYTYPTMSIMGAGEWDLIGDETFRNNTSIYNSGGGNLRLVINQPTNGGLFPTNYMYNLKEDDPLWQATIDSFYLPGQGIFEVEFNVSGFVDGDNNKAEVFLQKLNMTSTDVYVQFWD